MEGKCEFQVHIVNDSRVVVVPRPPPVPILFISPPFFRGGRGGKCGDPLQLLPGNRPIRFVGIREGRHTLCPTIRVGGAVGEKRVLKIHMGNFSWAVVAPRPAPIAQLFILLPYSGERLGRDVRTRILPRLV